jgi:uncharacterized protein (TIGR02246 family)
MRSTIQREHRFRWGKFAMKRLLTIVPALLITHGAALAAESAEEGIKVAAAKFEDAFNSGDGAAVGALYTEDAAILPPDGARVDGRAAIAEFWQGAIDAGLKDLDLQTLEVLDAGDLAVEFGKVSLTTTGSVGKAVPVAGKYIVIWQRDDDGAWRLHRDIWNLDPASP